MKHRRAVVVIAALSLLFGASAAQARVIHIGEYKLSQSRMDQLQRNWVNQIYAHHSLGTWAPMKMTLTDRDLALMGLPPRRVLAAHHYRTPTAVYPNGRMVRLGAGARSGSKGKPKPGGSSTAAAGPSVASFAGTGFFGIRPGAWLLFITPDEIGWCSAAHVYGSPGAYQISTAGHCGKTGQTATVIGAVGNHSEFGAQVPVLIDFGKFTSSTGDAGIGKDWALIGVDSTWQNLVTPTMAFWGGPIGMYRATGEVVSANTVQGSVSLNPNPTLVQQIVHYGHGAGIGAGGTPRSGTAINWRSTYFTAFGAITPGDSGSGSNTLTGDAVGANRQAAGINTHIYVDGSLRTGLGTFAGTRATLVRATLANGQLVPYPIPTPIPLP
jgi:hypothetical protein